MYSASASTLTATLLGINMLLVCFDWLIPQPATQNHPNDPTYKTLFASAPKQKFNDTKYNERISVLILTGDKFSIVVTTSALNLSNFSVNTH